MRGGDRKMTSRDVQNDSLWLHGKWHCGAEQDEDDINEREVWGNYVARDMRKITSAPRWWHHAGSVAIRRDSPPSPPPPVRRRFLPPSDAVPPHAILTVYTYHKYLPFFSSYMLPSYSSSTRNILFIYLLHYILCYILYYIIFYFVLTIRRVRTMQ